MENNWDFSRPPPFQEHFYTALDQLERIDWSYLFSRPVNALEYPKYNEVVTQPMDYSTMRKRVKGYHYCSADDFQKDFDLIIDNCLGYHPEVSMIYDSALNTKQQSVVIMQELRENVARVVGECSQALASPKPIIVEDVAGFTRASDVDKDTLPELNPNELETELGEDNYRNDEPITMPRSTDASQNLLTEMLQLISRDALVQETPMERTLDQEPKEMGISLQGILEHEWPVQEPEGMEIQLRSRLEQEWSLQKVQGTEIRTLEQELQLQEAQGSEIPLQSTSEQESPVQEAQSMEISFQKRLERERSLQEAQVMEIRLESTHEEELPKQEAQAMETSLHSRSEQKAPVQEAQETNVPLQSTSERQPPVQEAQVMEISLQSTSEKETAVRNTVFPSTSSPDDSLDDTVVDCPTPPASVQKISSSRNHGTKVVAVRKNYPTKRQRLKLSYNEQLNILLDMIADVKAKTPTGNATKTLQNLSEEYKRLSSLVTGFPPLKEVFSTKKTKRGRPRSKKNVCRRERKTETLTEVIMELGEAQRKSSTVPGAAKRSANSASTDEKQEKQSTKSCRSRKDVISPNSKPNYVELSTDVEMDVESDIDDVYENENENTEDSTEDSVDDSVLEEPLETETVEQRFKDMTEEQVATSPRTRYNMSLRNRHSFMFRPKCPFFGPSRSSSRLRTRCFPEQSSGPSCKTVTDLDSESDAAAACSDDDYSTCQRRTKRVAKRSTKSKRFYKRRSRTGPSEVSDVNILEDVLRGGRLPEASKRKPSKAVEIVSAAPAVTSNAVTVKPCIVKLESLKATDLKSWAQKKSSRPKRIDKKNSRISSESSEKNSVISCSPSLDVVNDANGFPPLVDVETLSCDMEPPILTAFDAPELDMKSDLHHQVETVMGNNDVCVVTQIPNINDVLGKEVSVKQKKEDQLPFWSLFGSSKKQKHMLQEKVFVREISKRELLISCMKKYPELWKIPIMENEDEKLHKTIWQDIAFELDCSVTKLKKQWRHLRKDFLTKHKEIEISLPQAMHTPDMIAKVAWTQWNFFHQLMFLHPTVSSAEEQASKSKTSISTELDDKTGATEVGSKLARRSWQLPSAPDQLQSVQPNSSSMPEQCKRETRLSVKRSIESDATVGKVVEFDVFGKRIGQLASQLPGELSAKCMKLVTEVMHSFTAGDEQTKM